MLVEGKKINLINSSLRLQSVVGGGASGLGQESSKFGCYSVHTDLTRENQLQYLHEKTSFKSLGKIFHLTIGSNTQSSMQF